MCDVENNLTPSSSESAVIKENSEDQLNPSEQTGLTNNCSGIEDYSGSENLDLATFLNLRLNYNSSLDDQPRGTKIGKADRGQKAKWRTIIIFAVLIIGSNAITASISVMLTKSSCGLCPATAVVSCPSEWVGYEGRCYYFSESEGTWNSSQTNCSASTASLVAIESQKEMNFIMQHKKATDYWIGLKRKEGQLWEWANGSIFNGWFEIRANGFCAYLNDEKASSTWCNTQRNWICSKTAHGTLLKVEDRGGQRARGRERGPETGSLAGWPAAPGQRREPARQD